jgi:anti-sigma regulatory factor (Ser/Thr protein kinase)
MDTMALTRPTVQRQQRISLIAASASPAAARSKVRAAINAWEIPVDVSVAVLLVSELVTNAIRHEETEAVTLIITCACDQLRVEVHDTSRSLPVTVDGPADAEAGRGLMLVAKLSDEWGFYGTPTGKAVYFALTCQANLDKGQEQPAGRSQSCPVNREPRHIHRTPCGPFPSRPASRS